MEKELVEWWFKQTTIGQAKILNHGNVNISDGPDLFNIILKYNNTQYSGSCEIDLVSANWFKHGHFQNLNYEHCLLHLFQTETHPFYHGFIPRFSYSVNTELFTENKTLFSNQLEKKKLFFKHYLSLYSQEDVFLISLARSLGLFSNREIFTALALDIIEHKWHTVKQDHLFNYLLSAYAFKHKAVRPNNHPKKRLACLIEILPNLAQINQFCTNLINSRVPLLIVHKELRKFFNLYYKHLGLGSEWILLFIYNSLIPLTLAQKNNIATFDYYLESLWEDIHLEKYLKLSY